MCVEEGQLAELVAVRLPQLPQRRLGQVRLPWLGLWGGSVYGSVSQPLPAPVCLSLPSTEAPRTVSKKPLKKGEGRTSPPSCRYS